MTLADLQELEQRWIWDPDYRDAPPWVRIPVEAARALLFVLREFLSGELALRAMSLVYTSILSLVPLLAFSFSVLKGFGVQNQVEPLLLEYLAPLGEDKAAEISGRIVEFVNNIDVRVLGALGLGVLVFTIVTLMQKIEAAFNHAWHIRSHRSFAERFSTFISVLTVGPLLVFAALAITGTIMNNAVMQWLSGHEPFGMVIRETGRLVPYLLVIAAFTFLYILIPNTRVRLLPALSGGVVAGLLWETAGYFFAYFVASATKYQAVYATFGTAMFFMIWLYVSWLILLVGASTAYYAQQPRAVVARARRWRFSSRTFEEITLALLATITARQYAKAPPYSAAALSEAFILAEELVEEALGALESCGMVKRTAETPPGYVVAIPPEDTRVAEVVAAIRAFHPAGSRPVRPPALPAIRILREANERALSEALGGLSVKALAESCEAAAPLHGEPPRPAAEPELKGRAAAGGGTAAESL